MRPKSNFGSLKKGDLSMRQALFAAIGGATLGVLAATQLTSPLSAQENDARSTYEHLDLFGDIFERIRAVSLAAGTAAGYAAGEVFASPRVLGTGDLMGFLFPGDKT